MIPVADPGRQYRALREEIDAAVARVLASGHFILGPEVEALEAEFAAYCGTAHAVAVASGTDAIRLTLRAAGIGPGDEVIVPALTAAPTAAAVVEAGARPVLADVDPRTATLDPRDAAARIGPRTRALLPVHLYGGPADLEPLLALAARHGLLLIEDAAQAHGARYRGRVVGSAGHAGCFSFYPTKNLGALGDGGMVVTNDAALAERVRRLRNLGQEARFQHVEPAGHSRLDEIQAAVLRAKLPHLDVGNARRREIAARYAAALAGAPLLLPATVPGGEHCYHLYVVQVEDREAVRAGLASRGVATDVHYPAPLHLLPAFAGPDCGPGDLPAAEALAGRVLSLPMFPELTDGEVAQVADGLLAALAAGEAPSPGRGS